MNSIRSLIHRADEKLEEDAQAWQLTRGRALAIALLPIVGALVVLATVPFTPVFLLVTAENSLLEWPQFFFVLAASLLAAWLGTQLIHKRQLLIGCLYVVAAVGAFFVAGEEISWGQQVFGWETPETLNAMNHQGETNIHNIRPIQRAFHYVVLLTGIYGTLAPLLGATFLKQRSRSTLGYLLIPPLFLVPAFMMPFGYRLIRLVFLPTTHFIAVKIGEWPELCLYFGLLLFTWLNVRRLHE